VWRAPSSDPWCCTDALLGRRQTVEPVHPDGELAQEVQAHTSSPGSRLRSSTARYSADDPELHMPRLLPKSRASQPRTRARSCRSEGPEVRPKEPPPRRLSHADRARCRHRGFGDLDSRRLFELEHSPSVVAQEERPDVVPELDPGHLLKMRSKWGPMGSNRRT
jgi:hypothetical protein